ncbi:CFEM domain-containing protein [Fusarium sp. LHS14.1]|nr:CFEM domain-containing protein [Fusarium sp. LHS14.1]
MPNCASDCLVKFLQDSKCEPTDAECICADTVLNDNVGACTLTSCTVVEALAARNGTATLCGEPVRDRTLIAPVATAVSGSLALAFVALRVFECLYHKEFRWADICAVCAMPTALGRISTLSEQQITNVVKYTWVTQVFYIPAICLTKIAIISIFIRVFPERIFQVVCWGTIAHCALFMVTTTITAILACVPVAAAWTNWKGTKEGVCYDNNAFWWAHSAINIVTDLWIIALPIPQLIKLQLGRKKKIYLIMMFSVGIIITVVSIVRFSGLVTYSATSNPTYNNVMVATYSVIECNVSIICCCMPALLAFLRRAYPSLFGSTNRSLEYRSKIIGGSKSPFASNGIRKSVTQSVSYMPRSDDSDVEENKPDRYHRW